MNKRRRYQAKRRRAWWRQLQQHDMWETRARWRRQPISSTVWVNGRTHSSGETSGRLVFHRDAFAMFWPRVDILFGQKK